MLLRGALLGVLQTVLLGDAAHTMSPVLGQGLNAGLEDVAVFGQCLEQHQGDVDTALLAYNRARLPDVQAIMTINEVASSQDAGLASQVKPASPFPACFPSCPALLVCLPCLSLPFASFPLFAPLFLPACLFHLLFACPFACPLYGFRDLLGYPCLPQDMPAMPRMSLVFPVCCQCRAHAKLPLTGAWHRLPGHQESVSAVVQHTMHNQASPRHEHAELQVPNRC